MMEYMDDDDFGTSDPIKDFLDNKLKEIQLQNEKSKETLQELEDQIRQFHDERIHNDGNQVIIEKSRVKIVNGQYVLWFSVQNKSTRKISKTFHLILKWNVNSSFLYKIVVFNSEKLERTELLDTSNLAVIFKVPDFLENLQIQLTGTFLWNFDDGHEEFSVDLPEIWISPRDLTNREITVPNFKLIERNLEDFSSYLVSCEKSDFLRKIKNPLQDFNSILEINASLYRIEFEEIKNGKIYYLSHKLSSIFDGTIVELSQEDILTIYHKNDDSLVAFIHHLYQNVDSLSLIPINLSCYIPVGVQSEKECKEKLKNSIEKEIKFTEDFLRKFSGESEEIRDFKLKLCDLELDTDVAYVQLKKAEEKENE